MIKSKLIGSCNHVLQVDLQDFTGRAFFSTDLHGHYDLLHEKLRGVGFNAEMDILFLGADMCDRGPDSRYVLDYLNEPWMYCVQGNHERMVIDFCDALATGDEREARQPYQMLFCNGGEWFFDLNTKQQMDIYQTFKSLPLALEVLTPTEKIGIVHAEVPYGDWNEFKNITKAELKWNGEAIAQWARTKYDRQDSSPVKNIDRVLVGHTPTDSGDVEILGNTWYCDLGSFFRDKISFIQIM